MLHPLFEKALLIGYNTLFRYTTNTELNITVLGLRPEHHFTETRFHLTTVSRYHGFIFGKPK